jgi:[ribosomal protein S18]-alanine N-acetyltransferase
MPAAGAPPHLRQNEISIRRARPSDLDALADLEVEAFASDRMSRRSISALVRSPSARVIVAQRGTEIVGAAVVLTRRGSRVARLYSLAVADRAARSGVGSRLLDVAEAAARAAGASTLRLEVRADNPRGIGFYEGKNFRLSARRENYYEDGVTALLYSRDLTAAVRVASPQSLGQAA